MYNTLLILHSLFRWLALASLLIAIIRAYTGLLGGKLFTSKDNLLRHITDTLAHIRLALGLSVFYQSGY